MIFLAINGRCEIEADEWLNSFVLSTEDKFIVSTTRDSYLLVFIISVHLLGLSHKSSSVYVGYSILRVFHLFTNDFPHVK